MTQKLLFSMREVAISFAKHNLFDDLSFNIFLGDHICLIGKNGVGKTTLMKAILNKIDIDQGVIWQAPDINIGYLSQNMPEFDQNTTIFDFIASKINIDDEKLYLIDIICQNLQIDKNLIFKNLSGGQKRRANLAQALILKPDILLLDEPTNHLDLATIKWLEQYLSTYSNSLIIISHDRKFLERTTNKIFWLRSNKLNINNNGYKNFNSWSNSIIEHEQRQYNNLQKKYELEKQWLQTGVTARRKRNIGRLHYLKDLQQKIITQHNIIKQNKTKINISSSKLDHNNPQIIATINNISKKYDQKQIINNLSFKILRGEKIGIIGKNGSGKSTFLEILTKKIQPTSGTIKHANDIAISYFDQNRNEIKDNMTLHDILCENGSDYVQLANNKLRHVCGYLKDFLFDPKDLKTKASTLSGGQQNRLLLSKILANPGNFLILDEPTNDLDMQSLDILEEYLLNYQGTLIVVSHDRNFLDNIATSIIGFEEDCINIFYGNYSDYQSYYFKNENTLKQEESKKNNIKKTEKKIFKLSNKEKFELKNIINKISNLEDEINHLNEILLQNPANSQEIIIKLSNLAKDLSLAEERWQYLEELNNN